MANEYVTRCYLEINGQDVADFKTVTEKPRELRKQHKLMNKVGFSSVLPQHMIDVEYVIPEDAPEFDFEGANGTGLKDATLGIIFQNGTKISFSGVSVLTIGEMKIDGFSGKGIPV